MPLMSLLASVINSLSSVTVGVNKAGPHAPVNVPHPQQVICGSSRLQPTLRGFAGIWSSGDAGLNGF